MYPKRIHPQYSYFQYPTTQSNSLQKQKASKIHKIQDWLTFNGNGIGTILSILLITATYYFFTTGARSIDFSKYTEEVKLIHIQYQRHYALPALYSTEEKLDRIVFDLNYEYQGEKYASKCMIYREYLSPSLEKILDEGELEKIAVRCQKDHPEKVMVFEDK